MQEGAGVLPQGGRCGANYLGDVKEEGSGKFVGKKTNRGRYKKRWKKKELARRGGGCLSKGGVCQEEKKVERR